MSGVVDLLGDKLLSKKGEIDTSSLKFENDEVLGLYFSAHWCPPCRGFTPKLVEFYKKLNGSVPKLKIVFVSSDKEQGAFDEYYNEMPWLALPFSDRNKKQKLSQLCKVSGIPSLHLFDSDGNKLKTEGEARSLVGENPEGKGFPWPQKPLTELLAGKIVDKDGKESSFEELRDGGYKLGIYFSAHWCPPCRSFTPQLVETYKKVQEKGHKFEIVFASSDKDEGAFKEYLGTMPWKAIPFGDERKGALSNRFGVEGIPTFVILEADGTIISQDGRSSVSGDKNGDEFPWYPKPVNSLSEAAGSLNDLPVLILFADGDDDEVKEIGKKLLQPAAEKLGKAALPGNDEAELLFVTAGGDNDDDLCNRVRQFAKLPKASEKPSLLIILNVPEVSVYVHEGNIESASDVQAIVDDFKAEKLSFRSMKG